MCFLLDLDFGCGIGIKVDVDDVAEFGIRLVEREKREVELGPAMLISGRDSTGGGDKSSKTPG